MNPLISIADIKKHEPCHPRWNRVVELALRFERASYAAVNARTARQAALMAEREATGREAAQ